MDKNIKWVTIKGNHIPIKKGQTPEEAFQEFLNNRGSTDVNFDPDEDTNELLSDDEVDVSLPLKKQKIKVQKSSNYWGYDHDIRSDFNKMQSFEWYNDEVVEMVNSVNLYGGVKLKDTCTPSKFDPDKMRIIIDIGAGDSTIEIGQKYFHEMGHASDCIDGWHYKSSEFISPKHGKTLSEMLKEEFAGVDSGVLQKIFNDWNDKIDEAHKKYKDSELSHEEYCDIRDCLMKCQTDLADITQGQTGDKNVMVIFGWTPHPPYKGKPYYDQAKFLAGTEFFAEVTCDLATNKNQDLVKALKRICPKTLEIYHEIRKEITK